jgi:hypothetical protein
VLTIFACPKPFLDPHIAIIQRNAIFSWARLYPKPQVILFGAEEGVMEAARQLGVQHFPDIGRSEYGTPLLSSLFDVAQHRASHHHLCFINADIILLPDFLDAVRSAVAIRRNFLMVGQRTDLDITEELDFDADWSGALHRKAQESGRIRPPEWIDYFVFTRGLFGEIPPFAIGRPFYDNWLVRQAIRRAGVLIDATPSVTAIHQNHDYAHSPGDNTLKKGPESERNAQLLGNSLNYRTIAHATHVLTPSGVRGARGGLYTKAKRKLRYQRLYLSLEPMARRLGLKGTGLSRWLGRLVGHAGGGKP